MPLLLQVGFQQKVGMPDYGSLGASCHVELELDSQQIARDPAEFQAEVRRTFNACRQAVQDELARNKPAARNGSPRAASNHRRQTHGDAPRPATASQVRALQAIAGRHQIDLTAELQQRYSVAQPEDLELSQASELIDELNQTTYGSRT